jgi:hypothetical protein
MDKALLQTRLSIVMVKENYNFLNTLRDFQIKLKKYFAFEYTEDEIEDALHQMEENYIVQQFEEDQEHQLIEYPEDYKF